MKESFVVTASQDCTIKVWRLPESLSAKVKAAGSESLRAHLTEKAHDKVPRRLGLEGMGLAVPSWAQGPKINGCFFLEASKKG